MTTTKRKFISLREKLTAVAVAFVVVEEEQGLRRARLISELDAILSLLSQMLVQHADRRDLVADIRERIDSTLDERLRLSVGGRQSAVSGSGADETSGATAHCPLPTAHCRLPTADCLNPSTPESL